MDVEADAGAAPSLPHVHVSGAALSEPTAVDFTPAVDLRHTTEGGGAVILPAKRGRGRPRKYEPSLGGSPPPGPRLAGLKRRGRPPKNAEKVRSTVGAAGINGVNGAVAASTSQIKRRGRPPAQDQTEEGLALGCPFDLSTYRVPWVDESFWQNAEKLYFGPMNAGLTEVLQRYLDQSSVEIPIPIIVEPENGDDAASDAIKSSTAARQIQTEPASDPSPVAVPEVKEANGVSAAESSSIPAITPVKRKRGRPRLGEELSKTPRHQVVPIARSARRQASTEQLEQAGIFLQHEDFADLQAQEFGATKQLCKLQAANTALLSRLVAQTRAEICTQTVYQQFGRFLTPLTPEQHVAHDKCVEAVIEQLGTDCPSLPRDTSEKAEEKALLPGWIVGPVPPQNLDCVVLDADMLRIPLADAVGVAALRSDTHADERMCNAFWALAGPRCQLEFSELFNAQRNRNTTWKWGLHDHAVALANKFGAQRRGFASRPATKPESGSDAKDVATDEAANFINTVAKAACSTHASVTDTLEMPSAANGITPSVPRGYRYRFLYVDLPQQVYCIAPTVQPKGVTLVGSTLPTEAPELPSLVPTVPDKQMRKRASEALAAFQVLEERTLEETRRMNSEGDDERPPPRKRRRQSKPVLDQNSEEESKVVRAESENEAPSEIESTNGALEREPKDADDAADSGSEGEDEGREEGAEEEAGTAEVGVAGAESEGRMLPTADAKGPEKRGGRRKKRRGRPVGQPRRRASKSKLQGEDGASTAEAEAKSSDEEAEEDEALAAARRQYEADQARKAEETDGYNTEEEEKIRLGNSKLRAVPSPFTTAASLMPHIRGDFVQWVPEGSDLARACTSLYAASAAPRDEKPGRNIKKEPKVKTVLKDAPSKAPAPPQEDGAQNKGSGRKRPETRVKSLAKAEARRQALMVAVLTASRAIYHPAMIAPPPPLRRCTPAIALHPALGLAPARGDDVDPARESFVEYMRKFSAHLQPVSDLTEDPETRDGLEDAAWFALHVPIGTVIDAKDMDGSWCVGVVMAEHRDAGLIRRHLRVRFAGWDASADDWISVADGRVMPPGVATCSAPEAGPSTPA